MPYERPNPRLDIQIRTVGQSSKLAVRMDEMLLDLRADSDEEELTVRGLILGMTDFFENRTCWRLTPASYEADVGSQCYPNPITIEKGPFRAINAVTWWDCETEGWQTVDPADYRVDPRGRDFDIYLNSAANALVPVSWPGYQRPLRIAFEAGFDSPEESETSVAGQAQNGMTQVLKTLVALGFKEREAGAGNGSWAGADPSKDYLLMQYRRFW